MTASHLIDLPGSRWALWRECLLRSAGFPISYLDALTSPAVVALADAALDEPALTSRLEKEYRADLDRQAATVAEVVRDPAFREAVTWQNRKLVETCLASIQRNPGRTNSNARRKWATVTSYLTRYAAKNDSIGFFGPFCWGTFDESAVGVALSPGDALVRSRTISLETWGIQMLSEVFGSRGDRDTWVRPRMFPYLDLDGDTLHIPYRGSMPIPPSQARALGMCDGTRSLAAIAKTLVDDPEADFQDTAQIVSQLEMAAEMGVLVLDNTQPVAPAPEALLRERLEAWDDEAARTSSLADLDDVVQARDALGKAEDAESLAEALDALDARFETITGKEATRRAGKMYAGRTLAYFDAHRDLDATIGTDVLDRVSPALSLVLDSARWFSRHIADIYVGIVEERFEEVAEDGQVSLAELFHWFERTYILDGTLDISEPISELQRRWASIIDMAGGGDIVVRSADIADEVRQAFESTKAGWPLAYFSPDLMIAATDVEDIAKGDFLAVLGEVHFRNTLRSGATVSQHPHPERLFEYCDRDFPGVHVASRGRAESHRKMPYLLAPNHYQLHVSEEPILCRPDRILPVGDLVVRRSESGSLRAHTRDGRLAFSAEAILGIWLEDACTTNSVTFLPSVERAPRVTIDNLVVARRKWRVPGSSVLPLVEARGAAQLVEARRLRRDLGMPPRVFASVRGEGKPIYLDFDSPLVVDTIARVLRPVLEATPDESVSFSEMLPDSTQCWLHDKQGRRYTSELRVIARERPETG